MNGRSYTVHFQKPNFRESKGTTSFSVFHEKNCSIFDFWKFLDQGLLLEQYFSVSDNFHGKWNQNINLILRGFMTKLDERPFKIPFTKKCERRSVHPFVSKIPSRSVHRSQKMNGVRERRSFERRSLTLWSLLIQKYLFTKLLNKEFKGWTL